MPAYRDRWTQDSVWYNFQPVLQKHGITVTRKHVKKLIRKVCDALHTTREALEIFAGARATMYFNGEWSSVSFDAIGELAGNGTDVIIIEKMALVQVLSTYADKYGIALVNTTGYFTEYGKKLMRAAESTGGHVIIITDYDMNGLHIASKARGIPRIGIDEETLDYFGLTKAPPLTLSYEPNLKIRDFLSNYENVIDRKFLEHSRVEIDAVLAAVGSERFWEYIIHKLKTLFPNRDYNRAIDKPKPVSPGAIGDVEDYIEYLKDKATKSRWEEIEKELEDVDGMIENVPATRKEIEKELQELVDNDARMKAIVSKFEEVKTQLKIDSDEDFAKYRKEQEAKVKEEAAAEPERGEPVDVDDIEFDESESDESESDEEADDT